MVLPEEGSNPWSTAAKASKQTITTTNVIFWNLSQLGKIIGPSSHVKFLNEKKNQWNAKEYPNNISTKFGSNVHENVKCKKKKKTTDADVDIDVKRW